MINGVFQKRSYPNQQYYIHYCVNVIVNILRVIWTFVLFNVYVQCTDMYYALCIILRTLNRNKCLWSLYYSIKKRFETKMSFRPIPGEWSFGRVVVLWENYNFYNLTLPTLEKIPVLLFFHLSLKDWKQFWEHLKNKSFRKKRRIKYFRLIFFSPVFVR